MASSVSQHHKTNSASLEASSLQSVLVVEDSAMQRKILVSTVRKWGFQVYEAASGEEALKLCQSSVFDIILSDWIMPGMTGLELCAALRELAQENYSYFILLTSKGDAGEIAAGLEAGADDFMIKPINSVELRARIFAGERIIRMQRELTEKNNVISDTLDELQKVHDALESDLREAKKLQDSLIPVRHKDFGSATISLMMKPMGHVGGDLVGFFPAGPDRLGLYSIDVSGHGISAALMTARLAGYLSASAPDQNIALSKDEDGVYRSISPAEAVEKLNDLVLDEMDTEHYFTIILADIDLNTGEMRFSQGGHPHPAIQRADGTVIQEGPGGFPVGLMSGIGFDEICVTLQPGDRVLLFSDGVTECADSQGNMLEEQGLADLLTELSDVEGPSFFDNVLWRLDRHAGSNGLGDDVSGLLFAFHGADRDK